MKKIIFASLLATMTCGVAFAQSNGKVLKIHKGGNVTTYIPLTEIDSITVAENTNVAYNVSGKVENGPMAQGGTVTMTTLDYEMVATGQTYSATVENNTGAFDFAALRSNYPFARLTAKGNYYNEVSNRQSSSNITLEAIVDLSQRSEDVNINVITHLKSQRILYLISTGTSFQEANEQAQLELLTQFGLQRFAETDATKYSMMSGDDYAGVLIAISSYILSDREDRDIADYLSKLTTEFKTTGTFSDDTKTKLQNTKYYLNGQLANIQKNLTSKYSNLGYSVTVKDLKYYFDWDDDGIAGNEFGSTHFATFTPASLSVPAAGGEFTVAITSDTKVYLVAPSKTTSGDNISSNNPIFYNEELYEYGFVPAGVKYDVTLEGSTLKIKVDAAQFNTDKQAYVYIYDARGKSLASVTISQAGDTSLKPDIPNLGAKGEGVVLNYVQNMAQAVYVENMLEKNYLASHEPLRSYDSNVQYGWQYFYTAINCMNTIKNADQQLNGYYQDYCNIHQALQYLKLASHWGGVPVLSSNEWDYNYNISRTDETELYNTFATSIEEMLPNLVNKKMDSMTDANELFFISQDVARFALAQIYCNLQQYDKASAHLNEIVKNGYYSLAAGTVNENNSETIFGLLQDSQYVPYIDYKDVLLMLAECEEKNGSTTAAETRVKEIAQTKGVALTETSVPNMIAEVRVKLQVPNTLVYLRRNGLGSYIGLDESTSYQLLWPIPQNEIYINSSLTQNPGYEY